MGGAQSRAFPKESDRPRRGEARAKAVDVKSAGQPATSDNEGLDSQWWEWKYGSRVHYHAAGSTGPPILMVHGFGAGGFHYDRNIPELSKSHRVWAIDLVGQGRSTPSSELILSTDTWTEQLSDFVTEVVKEPVYVMGNSLGGFLAISMATRFPSQCRGLVLLNATPFWWSFSPRPDTDTWISKVWPYRGELPAPQVLRRVIGPYWFEKLSDRDNIKWLLETVYHTAPDDTDVAERIKEATLHPSAVDHFISILFAPKAERTFNEMVDELAVPVCMVYGKEDPWIVPLWAQRLKRRLPEADYFELSPAGHCPHHEAPGAVNSVVARWVGDMEAGGRLGLQVGDSWRERCLITGRDVNVSLLDGSPKTVFERIDTAFYGWVFGDGR